MKNGPNQIIADLRMHTPIYIHTYDFFKCSLIATVYLSLQTQKQSSYLHIFVMNVPQAQATMADLQPLSKKTDKHFNMKREMMSLMYSDVTSNKGCVHKKGGESIVGPFVFSLCTFTFSKVNLPGMPMTFFNQRKVTNN